jgi:hypothetical protein
LEQVQDFQLVQQANQTLLEQNQVLMLTTHRYQTFLVVRLDQVLQMPAFQTLLATKLAEVQPTHHIPTFLVLQLEHLQQMHLHRFSSVHKRAHHLPKL